MDWFLILNKECSKQKCLVLLDVKVCVCECLHSMKSGHLKLWQAHYKVGIGVSFWAMWAILFCFLNPTFQILQNGVEVAFAVCVCEREREVGDKQK